MKRIVVIGGGTGTYTVLTGLKEYPVDLAAVVSMVDSGGSSGRLRDEFGILPPGDVRRALLALSNLPLEKISLRQLFEYRFDNGRGLKGHPFGNLLLIALTDITGREDLAIKEAEKILDVKGGVLPVTLESSNLCVRLEDGTIIKGETNIDIRRVRPDLKILDVFLDPPIRIFQGAKKAILASDLIVLGPGDLYTSVIPNLLVEGVTEATAKSRGKLVYVCNLMTKHGETDDFSASDFIREIKRYLGVAGEKLSWVLINNDFSVPKKVLQRYKEEKSFPVKADIKECKKLAPKVIAKPLAAAGQLWRHDSKKLAKALFSLL